MEIPGLRPIEVRWLAYIAGFVDGEGTISWRRLKVGNTYPLILFILREFFGGSIYREPAEGRRTMFAWAVYGQNALKAVQALVPFLIEKQEQGQILLKMDKYPAKSEQRRLLSERLTQLKHIDHG